MAANNLSYSVKACLTSALLAPGIFISIDVWLFDVHYLNIWQVLQIDLMLSMALSVPICLCFYIVTTYVNRRRYFVINKKMMLCIVGLFLAFLPVLVCLLYDSDFFVSFTVVDLMQPLVHALVLMAGILMYPLRSAEEKYMFYGDYKEDVVETNALDAEVGKSA
jgi:hypothetical protein